MPAVLEMLGIPYTGSDPLTLAVTLDKDCARRLVAVRTACRCRAAYVVRPDADASPRSAAARAAAVPGHRQAGLGRVEQGHPRQVRSSTRPTSWPTSLAALRRDHRQPVLVEEFIAGDELTVGVLGNDPPRIIGVMRVRARSSRRSASSTAWK